MQAEPPPTLNLPTRPNLSTRKNTWTFSVLVTICLLLVDLKYEISIGTDIRWVNVQTVSQKVVFPSFTPHQNNNEDQECWYAGWPSFSSFNEGLKYLKR